MGASGSVDRGPSELYLQLLKGEITSEEYMKRVGRDVANGRLPGAPSESAEATRGEKANPRQR
jgi:hypothetical protein